MGGAASFKPIFNLTFPFFLVTFTTTLTLIGPLIVADSEDDSRETPPIPSLLEDNDNNAAATPPSSDSTAKNSGHFSRREPFKPSAAVVVGVLTTMFSFTLILLLYIKHCNGGNYYAAYANQSPLDTRKNSGIDRAVVEALPMFRFASLRGQKDGLDCAVCLTRFEDREVLRLLPNCMHAFHVECVDKWLDAHSTCPLCRNKVERKDVTQKQEEEQQQRLHQPRNTENHDLSTMEGQEEPSDIESGRDNTTTTANNNNNKRDLGFWRVPGRHSSAMGERKSGFLEIVLQNSNEHETTSSRRSLDSASRTFGGGGSVGLTRDGLLRGERDRDNIAKHGLEHRINIVGSPSASVKSDGGDGGIHQHRWSDIQPSNLLYLTSEMIISDRSISPGGMSRTAHNNHAVSCGNKNNSGGHGIGGLNLRSFSEIPGISRFLGGSRNRGSEEQQGGREEQERRRRQGMVTRWSTWFSRSQQPRGNVR